jgi:hypothetical protein
MHNHKHHKHHHRKHKDKNTNPKRKFNNLETKETDTNSIRSLNQELIKFYLLIDNPIVKSPRDI